MNFGEGVKEEIFSRLPKTAALKRAFLAGLVRGNGVLFEDESGYGLFFRVAGENRAIAVFELFKDVFGFEIREISVAEDRLNRRDVTEITFTGEEADRVLKTLGIVGESASGEAVIFSVSGAAEKGDGRLCAFLRGLFVSSGSCTVPSDKGGKTGYHLELCFSHPASAEKISEILSARGIKNHITRRKQDYVLYVKSAEGIKDFIALLNAPVSVLKFTEVMLEREILNVTNRRKNCDLGNVNRQIEAQSKVSDAIAKIERKRGAEFLKPELRETAAARKTYSEDTLSELAKRLNVSKSCLNHRLRKITEIAEKL